MEQKSYFLEISKTGPCVLNIDYVVKKWNNNFGLYQYHDEFRFVVMKKAQKFIDVLISIEQANELIEKLKLISVNDYILRNAKTYRTEQYIVMEKNRIQKLIDEKSKELTVLNAILTKYKISLIENNK